MFTHRLIGLFFCVLFSFYIPSYCVQQEYDPLLVVVLMVKNEEGVIRQTLQPYIDAGIGSYLIFDTGSTDKTIPVTTSFFHEQGIQRGVIKQEPFVNFEVSRNRALELAEQEFPNACFLLMPDAEWYMHNVETLIRFCQEHQHDATGAYLVRIMSTAVDFYHCRLFRNRAGIRFVGVVHEVPNYGAREKVPNDCFFEWRPAEDGNNKSYNRWYRDCGLLLQEYERNHSDPRTVFYLAQTFACLGDWENACFWYKKRTEMVGWDEENFMAQYKLADSYENLGQWDMALKHYLIAYSMRPQRAEPLVRIAMHYWQVGEYALCFVFARRAAEIPVPNNEVLWIEKPHYDYTRFDVLGCCAWYLGEYEIGLQAVQEALQARPDLSHLKSNLVIYKAKIGEA